MECPSTNNKDMPSLCVMIPSYKRNYLILVVLKAKDNDISIFLIIFIVNTIKLSKR